MTSLQAHSCVRSDQAHVLVHTIVEHMQEHELEPRQQGERWVLSYAGGLGSLWQEAGHIHLDITAPTLDALHDLKLIMAHVVLDVTGSDDDALSWQGDGNALQRPPAFRLLRVLSIRDLTPHMRRVRFACHDLARYDQPDNIHCKLIFPQPGISEPQWPTLTSSGMPRFPEGDHRLDVRTYTIQAIDEKAGWMDVDFVVHADAGPGSAWASQATAGQTIGMSGPGGRTATPADWMLLAGDDTALPAMLRIAASLPQHTRGHVFAEVQGPEDEQAVQTPPGLQWHWLHRADTEAGRSSLLQAALRSVTWPEPSASKFLWVGAEFQTAQAIRQWAKEEKGLEKHEQLIVAYWRHGMSESQFKSKAKSEPSSK